MPDAMLRAADVTLKAGEDFLDGPTLSGPDNPAGRTVEDMRRRNPLQEGKVKAGAAFQIDAYFDADDDDLHQFQVWTDGKASVKVDDVEIGTAAPGEKPGWTFLPVALANLNGQPAAVIVLYQLPGTNALQVAGDVKKAMRDLSKRFPPDMDYPPPPPSRYLPTTSATGIPHGSMATTTKRSMNTS